MRLLLWDWIKLQQTEGNVSLCNVQIEHYRQCLCWWWTGFNSPQRVFSLLLKPSQWRFPITWSENWFLYWHIIVLIHQHSNNVDYELFLWKRINPTLCNGYRNTLLNLYLCTRPLFKLHPNVRIQYECEEETFFII